MELLEGRTLEDLNEEVRILKECLKELIRENAGVIRPWHVKKAIEMGKFPSYPLAPGWQDRQAALYRLFGTTEDGS